MGIRGAGGGFDFLLGGIGFPLAEVVPHDAIKEVVFPPDIANRPKQICETPVAHIVTIHGDAAIEDIIKTGHEI